MYQNFPDVITCGNMVYHVKLSRMITAYIAVQAEFYFLLLDNFFFKPIMLVIIKVILKALNWGVYIVYRGHEIFLMMKPGFLSNLNSCILDTVTG